MSGTLRLRGATSGYSELQAPAVAADQTFVLPTAGGTLLTTDSPISKLTLQLGSAAQPSLTFEGDTDTGLYSGGTNLLNLVTGGSDRLVIDSAGNVIIGGDVNTANAATHADNLVVGTTSGDNGLTIVSGTGNNGTINFSDGIGTSQTQGVIQYYHTDGFMRFYTANSEQVRIDGSGRVLIGTTTEGYAAYADNLTIADSGDCGVTIRSGTSNQGNIYFSDGTSGSDEYEGIIQYLHNVDAMAFGVNNGTERMRIDSSGNVGIGTASPDGTLHVHTGTAGTITPNSGADDLVVENSGDCGISLLTADGNNNTAIFFGCPTQSVGAAIRYNNSTHKMSLGPDDPDSATHLVLNTGDGVEAMRIDSSGRVGIGTTSIADTATALVIKNSAAASEHTFLDIVCDTNESSRVRFSEDGSTFPGEVRYNTLGHELLFTVNSSERMRIASTGQVLIGTTAASRSTVTTRLSAYASDNQWMCMDIGATQSNDTGGIYGVRSRSSSHNPIAVASAFESTTAAVCYFGGGWGGFGRSANELRFYTSAALDNAAGTTGNQRMTIDSSGNVGIGTGSPLNPLHIANQYPFIRLQSNSGSYQGRNMLGQYDHVLYLEVDNDDVISDSAFAIKLDNQEALRIHHNGRLQNYSTDVNGGAFRSSQNSSGSANIVAGYHSATSTSNGTTAFYFLTNGGLANYQSNDSNLCDEREKKNIVSLDAKWDKVKSWELKKFHYNEDADTDDLRYGVIAQQIEEHCPEVLTDWQKQKAEDAVLDKDGNVVTSAKEEIIRKGVKEQQMMWMAIKALQEAMERIESLETRIATLENN